MSGFSLPQYIRFMQNSFNIQLKALLYQRCREFLDQRISVIQKRIEAIQESRSNETKSSAGDKHEVGRSMMQLEEEKLFYQLAEVKKVGERLESIPKEEKSNTIVGPGCLVQTNYGKYFLAIGIGKYSYQNDLYYIISLEAPIAKAMYGKRAGDKFVFNQKSFEIMTIL